MPEATIKVGGRDLPLRIRINGPNQNFRILTDPIRAKTLNDLDPVHLDLLEIAATVFAADGSIGRGGRTRPQMGIDWRRDFGFQIPVRNPELWSRPDVLDALTDAVEFLTEDAVRFRFEPTDLEPARQPYLDLDPTGASFEADEIILFSGGLDSFAGALEVLSTTAAKVVLVSHRSAQKVVPRQVQLGEYLADRFKGRVLHVHVPAHRLHGEASDNTQRSRTLLFTAIGQIVANAFGARRLSFYENGIVSQNLPLNPQIVGTMATRTTHPLALTKLNQLMRVLSSEMVPIENRYQWLTKTEVVRRIGENNAAACISTAVSCTSVREQTTLHTHCGACSQCLDRRFAVIAAGLEQYDHGVKYQTDVLFGERTTDQSRTIAAEWTRHALQLGKLDQRGFMAEFGLEVARILRGYPELSSRTALDQAIDLHRRHAASVRGVLQNVFRDHADLLVDQGLPATSLIGIHLGQAPAAHTDPLYDPRAGQRRVEPIQDVREVDAVPDPDAPLRVAFVEDRGRPVVIVEGLGRVTGEPARVPHALRPIFQEDKDHRLPPDEHRFTEPTRIPGLRKMDKATIRQNVRRCRLSLAESFKQIHGEAPCHDLLIDGRPPRGYRLDPLTEILPPDPSVWDGR